MASLMVILGSIVALVIGIPIISVINEVTYRKEFGKSYYKTHIKGDYKFIKMLMGFQLKLKLTVEVSTVQHLS